MVAEMAVRRSPDLMEIVRRDQGASLMRALIECARLGHEPGSPEFYLIPRGGIVSGEESYRGIIKRILNSGEYQRVVARVVHERDRFSFDPRIDEIPDHRPAEGERGAPARAYAFAVRWDGTPSTVGEATPERIIAAKAKARGVDRKDSPWNSPTGVMYRKTAIRELASYVHTSAEPRPRPAAPTEPPAVDEVSTVYDAEVIDEVDVLDITAEPTA